MTAVLITPPPERARPSHISAGTPSARSWTAPGAGLPPDRRSPASSTTCVTWTPHGHRPDARRHHRSAPAPPPAASGWSKTSALQIASQVELDHQQRGGALTVSQPEDLTDARIRLGNERAEGPLVGDVTVTHVRPWIWRQGQSGGSALTPSASRPGYELRLSYYPERRRAAGVAPRVAGHAGRRRPRTLIFFRWARSGFWDIGKRRTRHGRVGIPRVGARTPCPGYALALNPTRQPRTPAAAPPRAGRMRQTVRNW